MVCLLFETRFEICCFGVCCVSVQRQSKAHFEQWTLRFLCVYLLYIRHLRKLLPTMNRRQMIHNTLALLLLLFCPVFCFSGFGRVRASAQTTEKRNCGWKTNATNENANWIRVQMGSVIFFCVYLYVITLKWSQSWQHLNMWASPFATYNCINLPNSRRYLSVSICIVR